MVELTPELHEPLMRWNAIAALTNNSNRLGVFEMPANSNPIESALFAQVQQIAPSIYNLLTSRTARLRASLTSHDVTGGYGIGFTYTLWLDLMIEQCRMCGETPWSQPVLDCRGHRMETRFMQIADAEGPTLEKAMKKLEALAELRLELRKAA